MSAARSRWPSPAPDPAAAALAELAGALGAAPGAWSRDAACGDARDDRHYPVGRSGAEGLARGLAEAKQVCAGCPVRAECLAHAIEQGEDHGVWGGLSPAERRAVTRRRGRRAAGQRHAS